MTQTDGLLFDPNTYDPQQFDDETRRLLRATIDWFEGQGKKRILDDDLAAQWPADFVDFVRREKLFATFLTPSEFADAARNAALSEILGFYGLTYWYTEQVTILGLGPIWQSENKDAKLKAADDLDAGEVMAFGLSVREEDILHTGVEAFAAALNTVNIGKFNLCTCSIGMVEHAFYEAITHAQNRILYGNPVTDFAHVRANFVDAYVRLIAMKLFSQRSVDYFRSASLDDRRYLLFNPMTKAKVTMEGETVLRALHDVIAAKGYEKNTMFREVSQLIGTLPRLEGTVHVNVGLVLKFMPNYMFNPAEYPEIGTRNDPADDEFFWNQGPTRGAAKVQFADWTPVYEKRSSIANVVRFYEQAQAFKTLLATAPPDAEQQQDLDFMLTIGHLFSLIVYGQLILEQAALTGLDDDIIDQIFDFQIRDFSTYAVALHSKPSSTQTQQSWAVGAIRKPVSDAGRFDRVWQRVKAYDGAYEMRP